MSVKVHEPVCLDSAQDLYFWFDHFLGDQLKDEWRVTLAGGATAAVVDAQTGGIVRLSAPTNATGDDARIDWGDIRSLLVTKKVTMEVRAKINSTANIDIALFLWFDVANFIRFQYYTSSGHTFWMIQCFDGAGAIVSTGITPDTDYHVFRIECFPTGEVHFYIDGIETANSPRTTNITANYLEPFLLCRTNAVALKQLDVDYVVVRQER